MNTFEAFVLQKNATMKNLIFSRVWVFSFSFSFLFICSHALAQKEQAQKTVSSQTRTQVLLNLADSLRSAHATQKKIALTKAKEMGWKQRLELGDGKVAELIMLDEKGYPVYYITNNANAAASISTTALYPGGTLGLSLEGEGMTIGEWDAGAARYSHEQLSGGRVFLSDNAPFFDNHSTHVCGTLIGDGTPQSNAKGMAPKAHVNSYDWNYDAAEMAVAGAGGLLVSNHSYGKVAGWFYNGNWHWFGDPALSPNESYLFGYYDDEARTWDNIAFNAPYYLIVKSAGNDRSDTGPAPGTAHTHMGMGSYTDTHPPDGNSGTGYDCLPSLSVAKNILTIGAVADIPGGYSGPGSVLMSGFSGWGPADDGRIKPDVVGNGVALYSCVASSDASYASFSGTSMSSPNVAGSCILLQEHYNNVHPGSFMRAATLKALVIHTADEAGPAEGPDYQFGWGMMNAKKAASLITLDAHLESHIQEAMLNDGATFTHNVLVDGTEPLIATLCWTDLPGAAGNPAVDNPVRNLVNDLDMRLINGTNTALPYILDPANPGNPATTGDNFRDNVEKIYIANPTPGTYTVSITHKGTLAGGSQPFSLILSGIIVSACSDPHSVSVSQISGNSVTVSWSPGNASVSWMLEYGAAGFNPGSGTVVTGIYPGTSLVTLSNLSASVYYDVYMKEFCAGGNPTNLIGPYRFFVIPTISGAHCESFDSFNNCGNTLFECVQNGTCDGTFSTGWLNAVNDNIDWSITDSATPSLNTGPENDHTSGTGKYLFTEASNCFNHTAILQSPAFDLSTITNPTLNFWYHMLGSSMGTLRVDVEQPLGSGLWTNIWSISGNQGQHWNNANISLSSYANEIVRFRFQGITGTNFESDIAIDDVCISSSCPDASACNDHNSCTADECVSGICFNTPLCTDNDACTIDLCLNGTCRHNPIPNCSPCVNSLATVFNGSTAQNGNMFDVTALHTIKILSFKGHFSGTVDFEIYYKPGSFIGYEYNPSAWNLLGKATATNSNGTNTPTPIPIPVNVIVPANETYAFYITATNGSMRYSFGTGVGNIVSRDGNLIIREGTSNAYPFGTAFSPRIWNGQITYECSGFSACNIYQCSGGVCVPAEIPCPDDNDACTVDQGCAAGQCEYLPLCDDRNPCTIDACSQSEGCSYTPIPDCDPCAGVNCNDNNLCTDDVCVTGVCTHTPVNCDDGQTCTADGCNPATGCTHVAVGCNDGNACTDDACVNGQCRSTPVICDDNDLCTTDRCDQLRGCTYTPINCSDNDACTTDGCSSGQCIHPPANCNDNDACTTDGCDPLTGCVYTPMNCDDGSNCTADVCINGICNYYPCNDNNPCTDDACVNGACVFTPKVCNDGNLCTTDNCVNGICVFPSVVCNDGNPCTSDACIPATGACVYTPLDCNDNDPCTIDNCVGGQCVHACDLVPRIGWQKSLGGTGNEEAASIQQTSDGGYIVAGYTASTNGDVSGNHGSDDYWVAKLDANGTIIWQKTIGGTLADRAYAVQQTADGGFVVAGFAQSTNGDVTGNRGSRDMWVVKLDANGNITWQKALGGSTTDEAYSVQQTADGGYIVAGFTYSNNGDVTGNHGMHDFWVVKLNSSGGLVWQKALGGTGMDIATSVRQTSDGGYIVAGYAASTNGDVTFNYGTSDYWVVKLDGNGNLQWQKSLGGSSSDKASSVMQTADGGYIVTGSSASFNGNVTGGHGSFDYWVVKLNASGNLVWQKALGGSGADESSFVSITGDGGYIVSGYTSSNNGNVTGNHGSQDAWILKLDASGNIQWQKALGGSLNDKAAFVHQTSDRGYIIAASSQSSDGDVSGNKGGFDFWIVRQASCIPVTTVYASACTGTPPPNSIDTLVSRNGCDSIVVTVYNALASCDDGNPCTTDNCVNNVCVNTPVSSNCDDNNCNTLDVFEPLTCQCRHTPIPPPNCNDNDCNTADSYNSATCQCEHTQLPPPDCNDNNCNTADSYNAATCQCEHTAVPPPNCDDGNCNTSDSYNSAICQCEHTQLPPPDCNDNNCNTADSYNAATCQCEHTLVPPPNCDDGNCNTSDSYNSAICQCEHTQLPPPDCNDNNCNTADSYNAATCQCEHTLVPPPNCDDGNCNTADSYNSATCQCEHTLVSAFITETQSDFCQGTSAALTANYPNAASYLWSTGATSMQITGTAGSTYSVTVTNAEGCTASASYTVVFENLKSAYTVVGIQNVTLYRNTVYNGGVGATSATGVVSLNASTQITAAMTFARAAAIQVNSGSSAAVQFLTPAPFTLPVFEANPYPPGANVNVAAGTAMTLTGSVYGSISIGKNSVVTFTASEIHATSITTKEKVIIKFTSPCVKIRLSNKISLGRDAQFNTVTPQEVTVFAVNEAVIESGSRVTADIYVYSGKLTVEQATALKPNRMTGQFIAKEVVANDYTYWYWNTACSSTCAPSAAKTTDNEYAPSLLKAYPNPFMEKLNIEFFLEKDTKMKLEIFNIEGKRLALLFEGNVKAFELQKFEYRTPVSLGGMVICRLQTGYGSYYLKALVANE